jgi:hypothetical protein
MGSREEYDRSAQNRPIGPNFVDCRLLSRPAFHWSSAMPFPTEAMDMLVIVCSYALAPAHNMHFGSPSEDLKLSDGFNFRILVVGDEETIRFTRPKSWRAEAERGCRALLLIILL